MVIRNIIFDWSGTLVDDLPAVLEASNGVFLKAGVAALTLDQFRREFSLPFKDFYDRFTPGLPMAQLEEWYHAHFLELQDSVTELPHARAFLDFCMSRGVRAFVLSTVHRDHFGIQAAKVGFCRYFEKTYVGVPDKRVRIHEVLDENRLVASETLFVGDMEHDIETAKFGGVRSCAVLTGYNGIEQLRGSEPDLMVRHLGELREILEGEGADGAERFGFRLAPVSREASTGPGAGL